MADCDDSKLKRLAESQVLLLLHRGTSLVGIPLIIAAVSWFAFTFDDMRFTVKALRQEITVMERNLRMLNLKVFGFDLLGEKIEDVRPN